jgi:hypothetical protein
VVETISGHLLGGAHYPAPGGGENSFEVSPPSQPAGGPGDKTVLPLEEVVSVRFLEAKKPPADALVFLWGGGEIFASLAGGNESEIRLGSYALRGKGGAEGLVVPLENLRGIAFPRRFKSEGSSLSEIRRWLAGPAPSQPERKGTGAAGGKDTGGKDQGKDGKGGGDTEDRLLLVEGAEISGVLVKIDAEQVHFQSKSAGDVKIPLANVRALSVAAVAAAPPLPGGITAVAQFQDGSTVSGRLLALGEDGLRLSAPGLGEVSATLDRLMVLSFRGGRCQYLSDLEPSKVTHRQDLFAPWEIRRDQSATGGPLRIRGTDFQKGLGMHSHCRADYQLDGRYSRFQSVIGMDDGARPESTEARRIGAGSAIFRVYVDDRVVLEKGLSWSDAPLSVDLPLDGARILSLELDYGPGFLVLGRGDWADARIIRK